MNTTSTNTLRTARRLGAGALGLAVAFSLAACASDTASDTTATAGSTASAQEAAAISITDPWIKAADSGMTAVFGTLVNGSGAEVRIVSATTTVSPTMELHEMAKNDAGEMVMRPKEGGFTIAANGTHELAPGGDHLMIMGITAAVKPGDEVGVTLTAEDGSEVTFTAPARTFDGGNENYEGGMATTDSTDAMPTPAAS